MAYPEDQDNPPMQLPQGYGTGVMEMRPLTGSASGPSFPTDVPAPDVHEILRSNKDAQAANRASMLTLNPMESDYAQKLGAHVAKDDLLKNEHEHVMGKMMPQYGGPLAKGETAPAPGEPIGAKELPQDEHKFRMGELKNRIGEEEGRGDHVAAGQDRMALANEIRMNPWGSPGNHPGVMGKIGHVLGTIGQIAGQAVAPGVVQAIPGTQANLEARERGGLEEEKLGQEGAQREAQESKTEAEVPETEARTALAGQQETQLEEAPAPPGPTIQQQYATAEQNLREHPDDPQAQKDFQMAADAITGIQKPGAGVKLQHVAGTVDGKPAFASYNPTTGQFEDPNGNVIPNFVPPPNFAQTPRFMPIETVTPQGQIVPGAFNTKTGTATPANPNAPAAVPTNIAHELDKELDTARNADRRLAIMNRNYQAALKGDQQAMVSLVANHIGMTLGAQKGARINQAVWNEAIQSTPWLQGKIGKFFHQDASGDYIFDGWKGGVTLTKPQMDQMVSLAQEVRNAQWEQVHQMQEQYGLPAGQTKGETTPPAGGGGGRTSVDDWLKKHPEYAAGGAANASPR